RFDGRFFECFYEAFYCRSEKARVLTGSSVEVKRPLEGRRHDSFHSFVCPYLHVGPDLATIENVGSVSNHTSRSDNRSTDGDVPLNYRRLSNHTVHDCAVPSDKSSLHYYASIKHST